MSSQNIGAKRKTVSSPIFPLGNGCLSNTPAGSSCVLSGLVASPATSPTPKASPVTQSQTNSALFPSFGACPIEGSTASAVQKVFPKEKVPLAGFEFDGAAFVPAKGVTSNGSFECGEAQNVVQPLGKFSFRSSTSTSSDLLSQHFPAENLSADHVTTFNDDALDSDDEILGPVEVSKAEWEEHYQKKAWSKKCRGYYSQVADRLLLVIKNTPEQIVKCTETINDNRRVLRKLGSEQQRLPDLPTPARERILKDSINLQKRRIREFQSTHDAAKERLEEVYSYQEILRHGTFSCRDFVIPNVIKKKLKNGQTKTWTTPSPGVPEVYLFSEKCPDTGKFKEKTKFQWFQHCGSPLCLSCANKKNAARREGIEQLLGWGLPASMVTLTIPHTREDSATYLMDKLAAAVKIFFGGRAWVSFCEDSKLIGAIRVLDWTWGHGSGHHPHFHFLFLYEMGDQNFDAFEKWLRERWTKCCKKAGLLPTKEKERAHAKYGCHVRTGTDPVVASYLTKLAPLELASPRTKDGRLPDRFSPHQLFQLAREEKVPGIYSEAYMDYMIATKGRRSFSASKGMRELMVVEKPKKDEGKYLFHFEPQKRLHNKEGIVVPGITNCEHHQKILNNARLDYIMHRHTLDDVPDLPPERLFQYSIILAKEIGALINFEQIKVVMRNLYFDGRLVVKYHEKIEHHNYVDCWAA